MTYSYDRRANVSNRHYALVQDGWSHLGSQDVLVTEAVKAFAKMFPEGMEAFRRHATYEFGLGTKSSYADMYIDQGGHLRVDWVSRHPIVETRAEALRLAKGPPQQT